ncbi:hypothetical protein [Bordetella hinzii]|uniref:hypothetical protein n=1 Tax=Bordetella hinzii TaxID=103855 RepID=UPI000764BCE4|nr:hypothetical protein [Bordetella hinzii]KXA72495.1 hypothetical protein AXA74_12750 [Bordetella hinzii LMG 13501]VEH25214.1 Uncharacterised protein [Bordetella hinzii]
MKFPLLEPVRRNGKRLKAGGEIELDEKADQAEIMRLSLLGAIRDVRPTVPAGPPKTPEGGGDAGGQAGGQAGDAGGTQGAGQGAGQAGGRGKPAAKTAKAGGRG